MMLVIEVVTTALLLVAGAAAQKPTTLDRSPVNTSQVREGLGTNRQPSTLTEIDHPHDRTKTSQIEIPPDEYLNLNISPQSSENTEADDKGNDFEPKDNNIERSERMKRKVIFGGGSYGHSGRRSGAVGGDPYGRRRDHHGPYTGPQESWPYRQPDVPYVDAPVGSVSGSIGPTRRSDYVIVTRTTIATPSDIGSRSSRIVVPGKQDSSVGRKSKSVEYETPKKKLTKNVKWEIAKYALQHGVQQAGDHYEDILGRKLPPKKVEKFIKRYQKQQKKDTGYHQ